MHIDCTEWGFRLGSLSSGENERAFVRGTAANGKCCPLENEFGFCCCCRRLFNFVSCCLGDAHKVSPHDRLNLEHVLKCQFCGGGRAHVTILLYYTAALGALEGDLMPWVSAVKSQQSLHKSTANRQYPAGTHMGWWGWG